MVRIHKETDPRQVTEHEYVDWTELSSVAWVCARTIPTEQPSLVGDISVNF
jgi:hypothetical protein